MMLFLLFVIIAELWVVKAQVFRMDYMYALEFKTYYRLHDLETNWGKARQICEAEGTSLLIPDSLKELESLKILMSNMKAYSPAIYIGLHDKYSTGDFVDHEGKTTNDRVLELLWLPGNPDNKDGNEHCVVMTREGLLDDRPCDSLYPFICKIYGHNVRFNDECNSFDLGYALPKDIEKQRGKCYKFHAEPLTWHDAYLTCSEEEGYLAIPTSEEEASLLISYMNNDFESKAPDPYILLIGFSDLMYPFEYRTIKGESLERAGYANWSPNVDSPIEMSTKRCGAMSRSGQLMMVNCEQPAMFICENIVDNRYSDIKNTSDASSTTINDEDEDEE